MTKRQFIVFLSVVLAWTTAVAVLGFANMPKAALPYARAHAPGFIYVIIDIWVVVPAVILVTLVGQGPFGAIFSRWIRRGREIPPDREAWGQRAMVIVSLFMAFGQGWQTAGLVLLWHKHQLPWVAQTLHGPHFYGFPDPHHLIPRLWLAAGGVLVAWFGNGLPKLLSPFRGGREPYDWGKMMRACGWAMTLGGCAGAACSLLVPDLRTALLASAAIIMTSFVAALPIWILYRLGGDHSGVAPPEGL